MNRIPLVCGLVAAIGASACRSGTIIDDWGPPAGFGAVAGVVRDASGTPKPNTLVNITLCESPIGGFLGEALTNAQGRYRVDGHLPPVGAVGSLNADTVRITCKWFVGPHGAALASDTVTVPFWRSPGAVQPVQRDITLP